MFKLIALGTVAIAMAGNALAVDMTKVEKVIALKNGSSVYIFNDGKMAMEDKLGRTAPMKHGQVMETKDGQQVVMIGNELARLDWLRKTEQGGN